MPTLSGAGTCAAIAAAAPLADGPDGSEWVGAVPSADGSWAAVGGAGLALAAFAATGAMLALHLAVHAIGRIVDELLLAFDAVRGKLHRARKAFAAFFQQTV